MINGKDDIFQITASVLGVRARGIFHESFKNRVSVSYSPPALPHTSPAGLQSQRFWVLVIPVQDPRAAEPSVGLGPLTPWGEAL